jgi:hypothetical protein
VRTMLFSVDVASGTNSGYLGSKHQDKVASVLLLDSFVEHSLEIGAPQTIEFASPTSDCSTRKESADKSSVSR